MKPYFRLTLCVFLLGGLVINVLAQSHLDKYEKRTFVATDGTMLPYRILKEAVSHSNQRLPLVLFLHGAGERGNDNEKQLVHGTKLFVDYLDQYPAIVIFPQCAADGYWSSAEVDRTTSPATLVFDYSKTPTKMLKAVEELVPTIISEFNIDKKRIYITGLSMGGMGTFELVNRQPKWFAAALPICGGGDEKMYSKKAKKVPFWVFHGADDVVVGVHQSTQMVSHLKSKGFKVKYTEYPGVNHDSWNNAFAEPDFLKWMFAQKR